MLVKQRFVGNRLEALCQSAKTNIPARPGTAGLAAARRAGSAAAGDASLHRAAFGGSAGGFRGAEDESLGGLLSALPSLCRMVWRARSLSPIAGGCGGQRVEGALQLNFGNGPSHPQWPAGTWCQDHDAGPSKPPALAV